MRSFTERKATLPNTTPIHPSALGSELLPLNPQLSTFRCGTITASYIYQRRYEQSWVLAPSFQGKNWSFGTESATDEHGVGGFSHDQPNLSVPDRTVMCEFDTGYSWEARLE